MERLAKYELRQADVKVNKNRRISPRSIKYKTLHQAGHDSGFLLKECAFNTGIDENASLHLPDFKCFLHGGILHIRYGAVWDFASGAIDTEDMKIASLMHDAICYMYKEGKLSFNARRKGDYLFRKVLLEHGCSKFRAWYAYCAVTAISYWNKWKK